MLFKGFFSLEAKFRGPVQLWAKYLVSNHLLRSRLVLRPGRDHCLSRYRPYDTKQRRVCLVIHSAGLLQARTEGPPKLAGSVELRRGANEMATSCGWEEGRALRLPKSLVTITLICIRSEQSISKQFERHGSATQIDRCFSDVPKPNVHHTSIQKDAKKLD